MNNMEEKVTQDIKFPPSYSKMAQKNTHAEKKKVATPAKPKAAEKKQSDITKKAEKKTPAKTKPSTPKSSSAPKKK